MFTTNWLATITRWASFATSVVSNLWVYVYDPNDEQDAISWVDWWQIEKRMITTYSWLLEWDKVLIWWVAYIIKRVKIRNSIITNHFEILLRMQND